MGDQWTGGLEYYRLLRAAFAELPDEERPVTGLLSWERTSCSAALPS
jgi:hypothetical protein